MADGEKKNPSVPEADNRRVAVERRELDDFWNIESLLPDRPTRRTPPCPRSTPSAVDVELPPRSGGQGTVAEGEVVSGAALTIRPVSSPRSDSAPAEKSALTSNSTPVSTPRPGPTAAPGGKVNRSSAPAPEPVVHYVPPHTADKDKAEKPLLDYTPDGVLLHRVRVFGWQANYHYFDQFVEDAERYAAMKAPDSARKEAFFSYFPQYVQMNRRQTAWYLWWRERVREGVYPDTDYAYVLLLLFELINLPAEEAETAGKYRDRMARTWMAYRRSFPQLDHYMCEWLCDYCLIHHLNAPIDLLAPALDDIILGSRLKEFYLSAAVSPTTDGEGVGMETARILLRHCCQYDYRKSKFAQGEHKALFDKIIPAAIVSVLPLLLGGNGQTPAITMLDSTVTRDAYTGALCSYRNKRRIEVAYTSFSRSHELRFLIGDMVKHIENRLRGWIGVRSRLSVMSLPIPLRDALDAYLNPLAPPKSSVPAKKKAEPRPAYEALYDLPSKPVSLEDAAAIEATSWETTRILTEAFGGEGIAADETNGILQRGNEVSATNNGVVQCENEAPATGHEILLRENDIPPAGQRQRQPEDGETDASGSGLRTALASYLPFIRSAFDGDRTAQRAASAALGKMPDAIADEINSITAGQEIYDMVLEDNGAGLYTVIDDYRDQLTSALQL